MAHQTTTAHWQLNVDVKPQGRYINEDLITQGFLLVQFALSVRASLEVGETPFDERAPLPFSECNFVTNWKAQPNGGPGLIDAQEEQYLTRTKARHVTLLTCFAAISLVFVFYNITEVKVNSGGNLPSHKALGLISITFTDVPDTNRKFLYFCQSIESGLWKLTSCLFGC